MGVPISNVTRRVVYTASGTGPYNFTFEILAAGDVAVYRDDTLLTLTTDYTVTINANGTGFITLVASPTGATQIAIVGNRTIQRMTDFVTGGDFFANTVNDEMDQQTIFAQQNAEGLQRALQAPQTDPTTIDMTLPRAAIRAGKVLSFDANGNPSATEFIGSNRGNWAAGTLYYVRDIIKDTSTSNIWQCVTQHTSTGAQPIGTNADAAKWFLLVDAAAAGASATAAAASASAAATSASNASTSATNAASSASTASTQASNASTSATNAANSATAAASSASTASTAATNAGNSATAAATSATNASNSASAASTSATNASNSATSAASSASTATTQATNASNSASAASTSASNASTSATNAANSASSASTSATNASNSATAAAGSATSAAASAASAAASLDNFDDRYLGPKSSNPTVDNDGDPLVTGALYYRTTAPIGMKVWDGSQWLEASAAQQASFVTYEYIATAGQTTFTGNDANGVALSYIQGGVVVSINGVVQNPGDDYTATNGTSIVLTVGAALNDEIMVLAFRTFEVANTYTQAQADSRFVRTDGGNGVTLASGNLGLGVTPSAARFESYTAVSGASGWSIAGQFTSTNYPMIRLAAITPNKYSSIGNNADGGFMFFINGTLNAVGTQAMTLDASGRLGLGETSLSERLTVRADGASVYSTIQAKNANSTATLNIGVGGGSVGNGGLQNNAYVVNAGNSSLVFGTNDTERARIDSSGNLLVGKTSTSSTATGVIAYGSGSADHGLISIARGPNATMIQFFNASTGNVVGQISQNGSNTTYSTSSDYRLKEDIAPMTGALAVVQQLKPCTYKWKVDGSDGQGFIAHELAEVVPDAVTGEKDAVDADGNPQYQGIDTSFLVATLTAAIQELTAQVNQLKADVAALKGAA